MECWNEILSEILMMCGLKQLKEDCMFIFYKKSHNLLYIKYKWIIIKYA